MSSKSQPARPSSSGGGRRRPPPPPVAKPKPWGLVAGVLLLALFLGAILTYAIINAGSESARGELAQVRERLEADGGVQVYEDLARGHVEGNVDYPQNPPVGGDHNGVWQNCQGIVYSQQIAEEHAVHALEHGAVWITYRPDLPADEVELLGGDVTGTDYMMLSPNPGQESPVVLTAWGRQLALDTANDARVGEFIQAYRVSRTQEPGATCSSPLTVEGVDQPLTAEQLSQVAGAEPMPEAS